MMLRGDTMLVRFYEKGRQLRIGFILYVGTTSRSPLGYGSYGLNPRECIAAAGRKRNASHTFRS